MAAGQQRNLATAIRQGADDLRFLAAHHVRHAACGIGGRYAGDDGELAAVGQGNPDDVRRDVGDAGRAGAVGRFAPALLAADHAAGDELRLRMRGEPVAAEGIQRGLEGAVLHLHDAGATGAAFKDGAAWVEQIGAQAAGAPVKGNQGDRHALAALPINASTAARRGSGATAPKPVVVSAAAALA